MLSMISESPNPAWIPRSGVREWYSSSGIATDVTNNSISSVGISREDHKILTDTLLLWVESVQSRNGQYDFWRELKAIVIVAIVFSSLKLYDAISTNEFVLLTLAISSKFGWYATIPVFQEQWREIHTNKNPNCHHTSGIPYGDFLPAIGALNFCPSSKPDKL